MSNIENVGARLTLTNGPKFRSELQASTAELAAFNKEQERTAALAKSTSASVVASSSTTAKAVEDEAARSEVALKAQSDAQTAASKRTASVAAAGAATLEKATKASTKILKVGALASGVLVYEGLKNYMSFQQMISQSAIDAGVKASQLPAFSKLAIQISNATGLAAAGTNGIADAMYRIASAYPGLHLTTQAMGNIAKQAANVAVAFGQTGDLDTLSRMYGAIESTGVTLGKGNTKPNAAQISSYLLAVAGHGDVKGGDLVAGLGTSGILANLATNHISLNDAGAAFDVLAPAMPAQVAATRLSHALSMVVNPSGPASAILAGGGLDPLSIARALKSGGLGGGLATINKFLHSPLTGKNYYSKSYGSGQAGFDAYLRSLQFTPAQVAAANTGGFAAMGTGGEAIALSKMFGGARYGATIQQLLQAESSGLFQNKLTGITGAENPKSYAASLKIAFNEPIVKVHQFEQQLKNLSIRVGGDVSPAVDKFLSDLMGIGKWFGDNRWAIKELGMLAGGLIGGAALIKGASVAGNVAKGAASIYKVISNPTGSLKGIFSGDTTGLNGSAVALKGAAASLDEAALALKGGKLKGAGGPLSTAERDGATAAETAGGVAAAKRLGLGILKKGAKGSITALIAEAGLQIAAPIVDRYVPHGKTIIKNANPIVTAAAFGSAFGPEGTLAGAGIGTLYDLIHGRGSSARVPASVKTKKQLDAYMRANGGIGTIQGTPSVAQAAQQGAVMSHLHSLADEISKLASSHDPEAQKQKDAAQLQHEAATLQKQAAQLLMQIPAQLAAAMSPAAIHAAAKTGQQTAVARK